MRRIYPLAFFAVIWLLMPAMPTMAQFWPGYGYGYGYGAWGGYGMSNSTNRYIAQSDRIAGERAARQQRTAQQNSIRNTMAADARQRTQEIQGQQQSDRNWWFQVQQQQVAQRRSAGPRMAAPMVPATSFEPAAPTTSRASTDIIKWLPVLCDPQFADLRAKVEAPYRRASKGLSNPTADDYRGMIEATAQMKTILKGMAAKISAQEYLNAETFLDKLASEAQDRIEKMDKTTESAPK